MLSQVRLRPHEVPDWPRLAWVASCTRGSGDVDVLHGPRVEARGEWCVEAAWDGPFAQGDFDRTDLVFGTGVRGRRTEVVFVVSGTMLDRLWEYRTPTGWLVSNSLAALLAVAGDRLQDGYRHYPRDLCSVKEGLGRYARELPLERGSVRITHFHHLVFDGATLEERPRPAGLPEFPDFASYRGFLKDAAERIGRNLRDPGRQWPVEPLTTISAGYDSTAASVIAREAGCTRAVTFRRARSVFLPRADSGRAAATALGLACEERDRSARDYPDEEAIWASLGEPYDMNMTLLRYPEPLALLFTAYTGDAVWDAQPHDELRILRRTDPVGAGLGELRLIRGVFHACPPYWGVRRHADIHAVTASPEMAPWTLGTDYDRPIARRIIESAGVRRGTFAVKKSAACDITGIYWPFSPRARLDFRRYLEERGIRPPGRAQVRLLRLGIDFDKVVLNKVPWLAPAWLRRFLQRQPAGAHLLTQWATSRLTERYATAGLVRAREALAGTDGDAPHEAVRGPRPRTLSRTG